MRCYSVAVVPEQGAGVRDLCCRLVVGQPPYSLVGRIGRSCCNGFGSYKLRISAQMWRPQLLSIVR